MLFLILVKSICLSKIVEQKKSKNQLIGLRYFNDCGMTVILASFILPGVSLWE